MEEPKAKLGDIILVEAEGSRTKTRKYVRFEQRIVVESMYRGEFGWGFWTKSNYEPSNKDWRQWDDIEREQFCIRHYNNKQIIANLTTGEWFKEPKKTDYYPIKKTMNNQLNADKELLESWTKHRHLIKGQTPCIGTFLHGMTVCQHVNALLAAQKTVTEQEVEARVRQEERERAAKIVYLDMPYSTIEDRREIKTICNMILDDNQPKDE